MLIFDVSLGIFISSSRAAHENRDEFIAFGNGLWYPATMAKLSAGNDLEPDHGFAQFLQGDLYLVDEVLAGFSTPCLPVIRGRRGAGPDQLVCDVVAGLGVRQ